jgi:5-methylcytosine-specific restriction endonuclease McrA
MCLLNLVRNQNNKCYYCTCEMNRISNSNQQATVEHLIDKWSSPRHMKIEIDSNLVAACFQCNNSRGAKRNRIARDYYKEQAKKKNMKLAVSSTSSAALHKLFGAVPQYLFNEI